MPLDLTAGRATLTGHCEIVEAEDLYAWICAQDDPVVDLSAVGHAHTAILQVRLATCPRIVGTEGRSDWTGLLTGPLTVAPM